MTKIKTKQEDSSLSTKALLVSVKISQWSGRRIDQRATESANLAHGAQASAGNYHKKLLPAAQELKEVSEVASQARKYFYEQTLPWMADGSRIISAANYLDFVNKMRKIKSDFDSAVKKFAAAYPKLQNEAAINLGDLYDASEYPEDIEEKFDIDMTFLPVPQSGDFRVELSDNEKRVFEKKMREVETAAMQECWNRIHSVVKTAAEKLADPKAIFRDSLIENITEIVALLPKLNITNDADLEKNRKEVEALVSGLSAKDLRTDSKERGEASRKLKEIEARMGAFMGGA